MKPERRFRQSVTKYLKGKLYIWAIHDSYQAGVPDHYYSGSGADLFCEYKYFPTDRTSFDLTRPPKKPALSRLQQQWLNDRYDQGRNVLVIVGMPSGGVILRDKLWMQPTTVYDLSSRAEIASEILRICT